MLGAEDTATDESLRDSPKVQPGELPRRLERRRWQPLEALAESSSRTR